MHYMDLSFLFDGETKINLRGLLAAIPVPLFLLLVYNLGVLFLVVIGIISPYGNELVFWLNAIINIGLFVHLGHKAARTHKLGLISFALAYVICFLALFFAVDYISYYLFANNVVGLGKVEYKQAIEGVINLPILQIMHYNCVEGQIGKTLCGLIHEVSFLGNLLVSMMFGFVGWIFGRWHDATIKLLKDIFSPKNLKR